MARLCCRGDGRFGRYFQYHIRLIESATSLIHRPVLSPTPPSTRRGAKGSRSLSPIRKSMSLLERATPFIRFCQPGKAVTQPHEVVTLRRFLVSDLGMRIIPYAFEVSVVLFPSNLLCANGRRLLMIKLQAYLRAADPEGFEDIPRTMFDESETGCHKTSRTSGDK